MLTTLGSRLEADARAQVECGPQWLTEFEKQRDSLEPRAVCELHGAWCAFDPSCGNHLKGSAAVSAAADPSPARPSPSPASAVDEGSGGASDILQSAPPEQPTPCAACDYADNGWCPCKCHGESDPGEVAAPAPGERVTIPVLPPDEAGARPNDWDAVMAAYDAVAEWLDRADNGAALIGCTPSMVAGVAIKAYRTALLSVGHEDLSAHLTGAAIRANTGHPDVLIDAFASSLLADYRITRK
ncbi:hypothetical protein A5746_14345 [Mycolicibacterium conceptionense]|nr:hypothetical protein A5746_14345 [Mycolicibacterium conceptionense]